MFEELERREGLENKLPISFKDIKKRADGNTNDDDDHGEFTQCAGSFPITYADNKVTYTPKIWEPGNTITEHFKGTSSATIENGTIAKWNIYTTNKDFLFSFIVDYCTLLADDDKPCPVPPGSFDKTVKWKLNDDPDRQPKDVTIDYYFNSTPPGGKFTQCLGTYPIEITGAKYTPLIYAPGQITTMRLKGTSSIVIEPKTIMVVNGFLKNKLELQFQHIVDYCQVVVEPNNLACPFPAGHFDFTFPWMVEVKTDQPKAQNIDYYVNVTTLSPDKSKLLSCIEGTITVAYP
ncbi:1157_t:CDS:2 [Entrophospora sp. SA101]|nr:1157_t:CDS:2 [Entrophospora sp. SA101]